MNKFIAKYIGVIIAIVSIINFISVWLKLHGIVFLICDGIVLISIVLCIIDYYTWYIAYKKSIRENEL